MIDEKQMTQPVIPQQASQRLAFIDNLRWLMILLVVSMHAAVTYSHVGSWYFMEDPKPGLGMTIGFATYQTFLQAFFMGYLFLIAGYFVPPSFEGKGSRTFLRDRAIRLGIPSLFYMLVINPFIVYWMLKDYYGITATFPASYGRYITTFRWLGGCGPMWFAIALLIFCLVYAAVRGTRETVPHNHFEAALPSHSQVICFAILMGLCSFLVRIVQPMGTSFFNMQLCYFSQYILLFSVGILARRRNWLQRIDYSFGMRWFTLALTAGVVAWFALVAAVAAKHSTAELNGGLTWQSAAMCFWEAFFCVGICLGLTVLFRDRYNHQTKSAKWMSDNCFSVYLFHPPFLIAITLLMRGLVAPKPLKFLCATILAAVVTWLASSLVFRRTPLLKQVL